jgi:hypothetical protein
VGHGCPAITPDGAFNGGLHLTQGALSVAGTARYSVKRLSDLYAPALARAGYRFFSVPSYLTNRVQQQTYGIQVTHATRSLVAPATHGRLRPEPVRAVQHPASLHDAR